MKIKNKRIVDSDCNEIKKQFTTTLKSMKQNINKNGNSKKAQKNYYYVIFDYEIMYGMYSTVQYSTVRTPAIFIILLLARIELLLLYLSLRNTTLQTNPSNMQKKSLKNV